jgi:hypothetical protein
MSKHLKSILLVLGVLVILLVMFFFAMLHNHSHRPPYYRFGLLTPQKWGFGSQKIGVTARYSDGTSSAHTYGEVVRYGIVKIARFDDLQHSNDNF